MFKKYLLNKTTDCVIVSKSLLLQIGLKLNEYFILILAISTTYPTIRKKYVATEFRFAVVAPNGFRPGKSTFQQEHRAISPH